MVAVFNRDSWSGGGDHCCHCVAVLVMDHLVKSGSSPGQSLDEFQIKGTRTEEQRLA